MPKQPIATCKCCHCDEQIDPTWRNLVYRRIVMVRWTEDKVASSIMTDRWTESRMSRRIKGGLNGQIVTSSNMIQLGRWTEVGTMDRSVYECGSLVCLPPLPLILLPLSPCQFRCSVGLFV